MAPTVNSLKQHKRTLVSRHAHPENLKAFTQVLNTLLPLAALWALIIPAWNVSWLLVIPVTLAISLFLVRVFVLMHECGHGSLFRTPSLNTAFGFLFGVVSGMPQYVWSQHHAFHHSTNGNWDKYRGPLTIIPADEYGRMSPAQQARYRRARNIWLAPLGGLMYLIVNPRLTWLAGTLALLKHLVRGKIKHPEISLHQHAAQFKTRYWTSRRQYWHMTGNNLALLALCTALVWTHGPLLFLAVYLVSGALAGGVGIILFTVQHNFEHSYAAGDGDWCYDTAALHGTSFLVLPAWLNWFTANIGYHHIHHLSARIPNYRLARCHEEYSELFGEVSRIGLAQVPRALEFILWDTQSRRLVSIAEYRATAAA